MRTLVYNHFALWTFCVASLYPTFVSPQNYPSSEQVDLLDHQQQFDVLRGTFTPRVIRYDRLEPVLFEAVIEGNVTKVTFELASNHSELLMKDDGTNGDAVAGDNIYSITFSANQISSRLTESRVFRPHIGFVNLYEGSNRRFRYNVFADVWTSDIPTVSIKQISLDVQFSANLVNIKGDVGLEGFSPIPWSNQFFNFFNDDYDYFNFILMEGRRGNRYHSDVRNPVQGIGKNLFDDSAGFGSSGKLMGYSVFPIPSFFDGADRTYIHEIGHQWINFLHGTILASGIPHWPYSDLGASVMGISPGGGQGLMFGIKFVSEDNGYRLLPDLDRLSYIFNDLELYLMGLVPADSVNNHLVLNDQSQPPKTDSLYASSAFTVVTINDIIQVVGQRIPDVITSQKDFRIATIVISQKLLSREAMSLYNLFSYRAELKSPVPAASGFDASISNPFYVATGGLATLNTHIVDSLTAPPEKPELHFPPDNATAQSTELTLEWFDSDRADTYHIQVATVNDLSTLVHEDTLTATSQTVGPFDSNTIHYWRVRGINTGGLSPWSTIWSFTTESPTSVETTSKAIPNKFKLGQNYPNPFNPITTIEFDLPKAGDVTLKIYNTLGEEVATILSKNLDGGKYKTEFDATTLASGLYLYRIQTGSFLETKKMLLVK